MRGVAGSIFCSAAANNGLPIVIGSDWEAKKKKMDDGRSRYPDIWVQENGWGTSRWSGKGLYYWEDPDLRV